MRSLNMMKTMAAIIGLDLGKVEEQFLAALTTSDAVGLRYVDGKPEFFAIDYTFQDNNPVVMVIDDIERITDPIQRLHEANAKAFAEGFDREIAASIPVTSTKTKPMPYYHGRRRF